MKEQIGVYFLIICILIVYTVGYIKSLNAPKPSPIPPYTYTTTETTNVKELGKKIDEIILKADGTVGLIIKNLKTKEIVARNEHEIFEAASIYKLWIMGATAQKIADGELSLDDEMSQTVEILNQKFDIDKEAAELTEGVINFTVGNALKQMITISHNYAALLLGEKITMSFVANWIKAQGFSESKTGVPPSTSATDIAMYFEKLYQSQLINKDSSEQMISILKLQEKNEKIPKLLPVGTVVAHKTGEMSGLSHDAGIVYAKNGDMLIVVLTDTSDQEKGNEIIANIAKTAFDFFK